MPSWSVPNSSRSRELFCLTHLVEFCAPYATQKEKEKKWLRPKDNENKARTLVQVRLELALAALLHHEVVRRRPRAVHHCFVR